VIQNSEEFYRNCVIKRPIFIPFFRKQAFIDNISQAFGDYNAKWIEGRLEETWKGTKSALSEKGMMYLAVEENLRFTIDRRKIRGQTVGDPEVYDYSMAVYIVTREDILSLSDGEIKEFDNFEVLNEMIHWYFANLSTGV